MPLPYPPPYQDLATLAEHLCVGESTIENWVKLGLFPPAMKVGGKRLWQWTTVERHLAGLANGTTPSPDKQAQDITNATRAAAASRNN